MARKAASDSAEGHGRNDILGVVFFALSVIVLIALFTYDRGDLGINTIPGNKEVRNWIGVIGARVAWGLFFVFGAAAYLIPIVLFFLSLGYLLSFLTYLQRRWLWSAVLVFACMGLLDLYSDNLADLRQNLNAPVGGIIGQAMNETVFRHFGRVGATLVFITVYGVSLLYLTNFRLGQWLRELWESQLARREAARQLFQEKNVALQEKALEKKAKELEKQAKKLQQKLDKEGVPIELEDEVDDGPNLGADLQPVPEPTVRDLSIPQAKSPKNKGKTSTSGNPFSEPGPSQDLEGEVITAKEIAAATKDEVLGKPAEKGEKNPLPKAADESEAEVAALNAATAAAAAPKPRIVTRKNKPITVALTSGFSLISRATRLADCTSAKV